MRRSGTSTRLARPLALEVQHLCPLSAARCRCQDQPQPCRVHAGFAVVKVATDKSTGQEYAVKIMNLPEVGAHVNADTESTREDIFKEIDILVGVDHENVLALKEYFEEGGKVCATGMSCIGLLYDTLAA